MADGFSFLFEGFKELSHKFEAIDRAVDKASMFTVREVGRQVKRAAKRNAPKDSGRLAKSIGSSRHLRKLGPASYQLKVWPHGPVAHKYAPKEEDAQPFMGPAESEVQSKVKSIADKAYGRAIRKL